MPNLRLIFDTFIVSAKGIAKMNGGDKYGKHQWLDWLVNFSTGGENDMNIAYVRVSTAEQNEQRQVEALKRYDIDKWFIDKCSGKDTYRLQFKEMAEFVREGDTVYGL